MTTYISKINFTRVALLYIFVIAGNILLANLLYGNERIYSNILIITTSALLFFILILMQLHYKKKIFHFQENKRQTELTQQKEKEVQKNIKKIYKESFEDTKYAKIFNKKIFTMIKLINELKDDNLKGVLKDRIEKLIETAMKLYIINLKSAEKMVQGEAVDISFEKEIKELLSRNNEIIQGLKDFITELILMYVSEKDYQDLIEDFERNMLNLRKIKEVK